MFTTLASSCRWPVATCAGRSSAGALDAAGVVNDVSLVKRRVRDSREDVKRGLLPRVYAGVSHGRADGAGLDRLNHGE